MAQRNSGSYHAGFLRGKDKMLFDDDALLELQHPRKVYVRRASAMSNGISGCILTCELGSATAIPFFVPDVDEVRYKALNLAHYIEGLQDGIMRRASELKSKRIRQLGA